MLLIKQFIRKEIIILSLLLIFLIDPFTKGIYAFYILLLVLLTKLSFLNYKLDGKIFWLLLFSVFYTIFYSLNPVGGVQYLIIYTLAPFTFYIIGRYFSLNYSPKEIIYLLFVFLAVSFSIIPAISIIKNIFEHGFESERNLSLIWNEGVNVSATLIAAHFTLNLSSLGIFLVPSVNKIERKLKLVIIVAIAISLFCILRLASRTQFLVTILTFVASAIYIIPKLQIKRKIYLLFGIFTLITSLILFYILFSDSAIFNTFNERNNDTEYVMSGSGRTNIWMMSVGYVFTKPAGWIDNGIIVYAHNLWLDVSRVAGILPFLSLCVFTVLCISLVYKIITKGPANHILNILILSYFIGFMAVFFVEPIMEGLFEFFLVFCIFIGILSGYSDNGNFRNKRIFHNI